MKRNEWITVQFVAGQRKQIAAWALLAYVYEHQDPAERIKHSTVRVETLPIIGVLIQHKIDQNDGIPSESRTVFAVQDDAEITALDDAYGGTDWLIGIFDSAAAIPAERIEEMAEDRREDELHRLAARLKYAATRPAVAS